MRNFIAYFFFCIMFACTACGGDDTEYALLQAENDLQDGKIQLAVTSCDMLADSTASKLSSTQMCRVAIIYAKVSEISNDRHYMVSATECLGRAERLDQDIDSLEAYIESLDIENQNVVNSIRELSQALNSPCDLSAEEIDPTSEGI